MKSVLADLTREAMSRELATQDFASTFLASVVGPDRAVFLQIGDGAIVKRHKDTYSCVFGPQSGEYMNTTRFLADHDGLEQVQIQAVEEEVTELAIFTDGIQMLALLYSAHNVYSPFFEPLFRRLRTEPPGKSRVLGSELQAWLESDRVNERTDDDKTLVLATREPCEDASTPNG